MGTNGFTPEEWRTAARIARRSIFTEGNPDLADAWEKAADQAEARLIPPGGMSLTAEQVENVRAARKELRGYRNFAGHGRSHVNQLIAAVDALFPATEPAEEETKAHCLSEIEGWVCSLTAGHDGDHTAYDQDRPVRWPTPSPVVPAPTETGPWETVDAIPGSVTRIKDCEGDVWHRCTAGWEHGGLHGPEGYAPFVAVEEG